jgi:hypothetical protein
MSKNNSRQTSFWLRPLMSLGVMLITVILTTQSAIGSAKGQDPADEGAKISQKPETEPAKKVNYLPWTGYALSTEQFEVFGNWIRKFDFDAIAKEIEAEYDTHIIVLDVPGEEGLGNRRLAPRKDKLLFRNMLNPLLSTARKTYTRAGFPKDAVTLHLPQGKTLLNNPNEDQKHIIEILSTRSSEWDLAQMVIQFWMQMSKSTAWSEWAKQAEVLTEAQLRFSAQDPETSGKIHILDAALLPLPYYFMASPYADARQVASDMYQLSLRMDKAFLLFQIFSNNPDYQKRAIALYAAAFNEFDAIWKTTNERFAKFKQYVEVHPEDIVDKDLEGFFEPVELHFRQRQQVIERNRAWLKDMLVKFPTPAEVPAVPAPKVEGDDKVAPVVATKSPTLPLIDIDGFPGGEYVTDVNQCGRNLAPAVLGNDSVLLVVQRTKELLLGKPSGACMKQTLVLECLKTDRCVLASDPEKAFVRFQTKLAYWEKGLKGIEVSPGKETLFIDPQTTMRGVNNQIQYPYGANLASGIYLQVGRDGKPDENKKLGVRLSRAANGILSHAVLYSRPPSAERPYDFTIFQPRFEKDGKLKLVSANYLDGVYSETRSESYDNRYSYKMVLSNFVWTQNDVRLDLQDSASEEAKTYQWSKGF